MLHLMFAVVSPVLVPYRTASLWLHHTYFHPELHIWYRFSCTFWILALSKISQIVVMLVEHMLFSYCDQQIVSHGIFFQISCSGIYLGCLDVPALINRDKHPICSRTRISVSRTDTTIDSMRAWILCNIRCDCPLPRGQLQVLTKLGQTTWQ